MCALCAKRASGQVPPSPYISVSTPGRSPTCASSATRDSAPLRASSHIAARIQANGPTFANYAIGLFRKRQSLINTCSHTIGVIKTPKTSTVVLFIPVYNRGNIRAFFNFSIQKNGSIRNFGTFFNFSIQKYGVYHCLSFKFRNIQTHRRPK